MPTVSKGRTAARSRSRCRGASRGGCCCCWCRCYRCERPMSAQPLPRPARPLGIAPPKQTADADAAASRVRLVAPLALLVAWLLSLTPAHQRLALALQDSQMQLAVRDVAFDDVAVVDIDD